VATAADAAAVIAALIPEGADYAEVTSRARRLQAALSRPVESGIAADGSTAA
jgi:hypothetical protein